MITQLLSQTFYPLECSAREVQIIKLIAHEYTTREIAGQLYISPSTVDTHRRRIFRKLNVKNSAGMVRKSFEIGILKLNQTLTILPDVDPLTNQ